MIPEITEEFKQLKKKKDNYGYNFFTQEEKWRYQELRLEEKKNNRLALKEKMFEADINESEKNQRIEEKSKIIHTTIGIIIIVLITIFMTNAYRDGKDVNYAQEYYDCLNFSKNGQEKQYCKDQFASPAYYQCLKLATSEIAEKQCLNFFD